MFKIGMKEKQTISPTHLLTFMYSPSETAFNMHGIVSYPLTESF